MRTILIAVLIFAHSIALGQGLSCPALIPSQSAELADSPVRFTAVQLEVSGPSVNVVARVRNLDKRPINGLAFVIELSRQGRYLLSVLLRAATPGVAELPSIPTLPSVALPKSLSASILPGSNSVIHYMGTSLPVVCPDKAIVTRADVSFADGQRYSRQGPYQTDPALSSAKALDSHPSLWPSEGIYVRLSIDERGRATVLGTEGTDANVSAWLTDEAEDNWKFIPATYAGTPITKEIWVLVRIDRLRANVKSRPPAGSPIESIGVVDFETDPLAKVLTVSYTGIPVSVQPLRKGP